MNDPTATPDSLAGEAPAEAQLEPPTPMRDGPRPHRQALVPLWVYGVVAAVIAVLAIGVGAALALNRSVTREVPDVSDLDVAVARTRLRRSGFEFLEGDKRFSTAREGTVLEQDPREGDVVRRGSTITVVVSAGTEEFRLPDIVGDGIVLGRGTLEERGLEVKVNVEASELPRDTVISTNPSPGSVVHTGDIVIVTIAASGEVESAIVPYRFSNVRFVLDPAKPAQGSDTTLDVSRRLRSLLEASGASVRVTRTAADKDTSALGRAKRAGETSATAIVGVDLAPGGGGGFAVSVATTQTSQRARMARRLQGVLVSALTVQERAPRRGTYAPDAIQTATTAPIVRVNLGSITDREDSMSFRDPTWADEVARAIYHALGEAYGHS